MLWTYNRELMSDFEPYSWTRCLVVMLLCMNLPLASANEGEWQGTWETNWRNGGATLFLKQSGDTVTGIYEPYGGKIEAKVSSDGRLKGLWFQSQTEGEFEFSMSRDGDTFSGHFDSGEWWNGQRLNVAMDKGKFIQTVLNSPRETLRSFLNAGNILNSGDHNYLDDFLNCVIFPDALKNSRYSKRASYAREFFHLIGHDTFRIFSLSDQVKGMHYDYAIFSQNVSVDFQLAFVKSDTGWKIQLPNTASLTALRDQLIAANEYQDYNPNIHFSLSSPRDTLRTFVEEFRYWHQGSKSRVLSTMNFSEIPEKVVDWEGAVNAQYLKRVLDRAGYLTWQEVPNDPASQIPYVHFKHPKGSVILEPVEQEDRIVWQFSPETLRGIRDLHDAIEHLPIPDAIPAYEDTAFFFQLRDRIARAPGPWTERVLKLEIWQWVGCLLLILLSWTLSNLFRRHTNTVATWFFNRIGHDVSRVNYVAGIPVQLLLLGLIWGYVMIIFGIPDYLFNQVRMLSEVFICLGLMCFFFFSVSEAALYFIRATDGKQNINDEIIVTLISSILKISIVVMGVIFLADILSIPYQTVVAGLGIGGVAFAIAARDTVANFFGSAVILTDRPFGPGDVVHIDQYIGAIESVGLRSTRIRDEGDSLIFIPNSVVSKDIIVNRGRRDRTLVDESIPIENSISSEKIDKAAESIHGFLKKDEVINGQFLVVGINEFEPGLINLRIRFYINLVDRKLYLEQKHRLLKQVLTLLEDFDIALAKPR